MALNNQEVKQDDCPLCDTSKEGIRKLSSGKGVNKENTQRSNNIFIFFLIFFIAIGSLVVYNIILNSAYSTVSLDSNINNSQEASTTLAGKDIKNDSINKTEEKQRPLVNYSAPDFVSVDTLGNKFALADFRGKKPVLLVFWATWCGFCKQELPILDAFSRKHQKELQVIAVSSGEKKIVISDYIKENNVSFLMLLDEERKIWNDYGVRGTPAHFLISRDGVIVKSTPGLMSMGDLEGALTILK